MIKQLWWVALAAGLACDSSGRGSADDDAARTVAGTEALGNTTDLPPGGLGQSDRQPIEQDQGANAGEELNLIETENGLVLQIERDGQLIERACAGTCYDVCTGCLLEACQFSGALVLCNAAADVCEKRCSACAGVDTQGGACDVPSCDGDLSCYFVTLGVPEEFRDVVRGVSPQSASPQSVSPQPDTSDPERAATPAEPSSAEPSSGEGAGAY